MGFHLRFEKQMHSLSSYFGAMHYFDRKNVEVPAYLRGKHVQRMRVAFLDYLQAAQKERQQTSVPDRHLPPAEPSIAAALKELFHNKCAFCERRVKTTLYRFRPTSNAEPAADGAMAHIYYGWLADAWDNIYPICRDCRPNQMHHFPVSGRRAAIPTVTQYETYVNRGDGIWPADFPTDVAGFVDPCLDENISDHLIPYANGELLGISDKGEETILQFDLNRKALVKRRQKKFAWLHTDFTANLADDQLVRAQRVLRATNREFGGSWLTFLNILCQLAAKDAGLLFMPGTALEPFLGYASRRIELPTLARHFGDALHSYATTPKQQLRKIQNGWPALNRYLSRTTLIDLRFRKEVLKPLRSVKFDCFKSLESLQLKIPNADAELSSGAVGTPALLILGENATGKSTILEGLALALIGPSGQHALEHTPSQFVLNPYYLGNESLGPFEKAVVKLTFGDRKTRTLTLTETDFKNTGTAKPFPVFAYGAFRHYTGHLYDWYPARPVISLFQTDKLLSNPEKWLLQIDENKFDMAVRALRHIFALETDFNVIERDIDNQRCLVVITEARPERDGGDFQIKTPLTLVSSGFRAILAMACDFMRWLMDPKLNPEFDNLVTAQAIVLIDEIEAHLHPRWKMQIMTGFRRAFPMITFIATTHDPLCLRGMRDGEVKVIRRTRRDSPGEDGIPAFIEHLEDLPDVSKLTIEQLLTSDLFSMFSTDDPETEKKLARMGDILVKIDAEGRLGQEDRDALEQGRKFLRKELKDELPVGSTDTHRLIQEALEEYLRERTRQSAGKLKKLRQDTRKRIVQALDGL
jgi:hypothetical protein